MGSYQDNGLGCKTTNSMYSKSIFEKPGIASC